MASIEWLTGLEGNQRLLPVLNDFPEIRYQALHLHGCAGVLAE
jgi:hypothetical protein